MRILVACEESQIVCKAFREKGHEAYSCDIIDSSGGHPEWHIKEDVLKVIEREHWDMMIAFPPCTYLTSSGLHWNKRVPGRNAKTKEAVAFVKELMDAPIEKIAIENPPGRINTAIRKPDQLIHPYYFGDEAQKKTNLWLKNLPRLIHASESGLFENKTHVGKGAMMKCVRKDGRIEYRARWNQ